MKKSIISLFAVVSLLTISGSSVSAQTADYAPAGSPSPTTCTNLTTNLGWGTTSADVTTLQNYLSLTGYMSVEATGYYGNVTMNAVSSYQTAHSIEGTGYVGPLTRTAIRNESCGTTASAGTAGTTIAAGSVVCPAGMTCTRATPAATPAVCPLGYVCQPQTGTASTVPTYVPGSLYSPGSAYTPGSLTNSASGNQGAGLPAGSITAAQYQALLQTQGQAASTTPPNAAGNTGVGASTETRADIINRLTGVVKPTAPAPVATGANADYFDYLCPVASDPYRHVCNKVYGINFMDVESIPWHASVELPNPNMIVSPSSLYGPGMTSATSTIPAGWTPNRSALVVNTFFNPDTWILNPAGQYYGFPCKNVGCLIPHQRANVAVARITKLIGKSCSNEISFETAVAQASLYAGGVSSLISSSTLHLKAVGWVVDYWNWYMKGSLANGQTGNMNTPWNPQVYDLCLDSGYVSNVPDGFDKAKIIALNTPKTQVIVVPTGPVTSSSEYKISATYNVTAVDGRCVFECGGLSFFNYPRGLRPVTVSIIQFNLATNGITVTEALLRLLSLGYRPAMIDEITAIQPQAGDGIPYLGTTGTQWTGTDYASPAQGLNEHGLITVTSSICPGAGCAINMTNFIWNGDKIAVVKL